MKLNLKTGLSLTMASALVLTAGANSFAEKSTAESLPAWAAKELTSWQSLGLLKGNQQGQVLPDQPITKAEFVTFLNRIFRFAKLSDRTFPDVPAAAWYASEISKAAAVGILVGDGNGKIAPTEILTREKAALMLARAFGVAGADTASSPFADDDQISSWSKAAVYGLKARGYVAGTPQGAFQPLKSLTRAEAVKMINNVMGQLIADSADHSGISGNNLVVNAAGGVLSGLNLTGDLYIAQGVGEGNLAIENSRIAGTVYVFGGGDHSVVFRDSEINHLVVNKPSGPVRVLLSGDSTLNDANLMSGGTLENGTTRPVGRVAVNSGLDENAGLIGGFTNVEIQAPSLATFGSGTIDNLTVATLADGTRIALGENAIVGNLILNAGASITGKGKIQDATINANNATLEQTPAHVTLNSDSATIGGKVVTKDQPGGTGNTGGNGGTGTPGGGGTELKTDLYAYDTVAASFADTGAQALVKQYVAFLQDATYTPSVANPGVSMPDFANAKTFVGSDYTVKPSIFASMRDINTSVLKNDRKTLWIGTDLGVTKINLTDNGMTAYTQSNANLKDDVVLLLIDDGANGVYAITETGVAHIKQ